MGVLRELEVALKVFLVLAWHPFTLVYPLLVATVGVALTAGVLGYGFAALTGAVYGNVVTLGVAAVVYFLGLPLCIVFLLVAYCYEMNELYHDRRPWPGEGLVVAAGRLPSIAIATFVIAVAFNASNVARGYGGSVGQTAGSAAAAGTQVASLFVYPAIALRDGDPRSVIDEVKQAVQNRFGTALVSSVGANTLGKVFAVLGLFGAVGLVVGGFLDRLPFEATMVETVGLAVGTFLAGLFLAILVTTAVLGPVATALYLYATDAELPEKLALGVDDLADTG